jgi:hypothetical protein
MHAREAHAGIGIGAGKICVQSMAASSCKTRACTLQPDPATSMWGTTSCCFHPGGARGCPTVLHTCLHMSGQGIDEGGWCINSWRLTYVTRTSRKKAAKPGAGFAQMQATTTRHLSAHTWYTSTRASIGRREISRKSLDPRTTNQHCRSSPSRVMRTAAPHTHPDNRGCKKKQPEPVQPNRPSASPTARVLPNECSDPHSSSPRRLSSRLQQG